MTPSDFYSLVLLPSSQVSTVDDTLESRVLLMAIAGQESGWANRTQIDGPARGYWQFDQTAVLDILGDPVTGPLALAACAMWDVPSDPVTLYQAIAWHDPLAYQMARLLLLADPASLPAVGDANGAYAYYLATWEPGDPRPDSWPAIYAQSLLLVTTGSNSTKI